MVKDRQWLLEEIINPQNNGGSWGNDNERPQNNGGFRRGEDQSSKSFWKQ